jgi:hypothetical protein
MEAKKIRTYNGQSGPEAVIQRALVAFLEKRDWLVKVTHGSLFQSGLPDVFSAHKKFGQRWIEVKNPLRFSFTKAQLDFFPKLAAVGVGIWILTAANEYEYDKLFQPPNWHYFLGKTTMR